MSDTLLEYTIYLTDAAKVAALQARTSQVWTPRNSPTADVGPGSGAWIDAGRALTGNQKGFVYGAPWRAARTDWLAVGAGFSTMPVLGTSDAFASPSIASSWIITPTQTTNPIKQDEFSRRRSGFWGWLFGASDNFIWRGRFEYAPAPTTTVPGSPGTLVGAIATRRWIDGFEHPQFGEGGSGSPLPGYSRAASRHADGYGFAIRPFSGGLLKSHTVVENGAGTSPASWERFYIRPIGYPSNKVPFWRSHGSISGSSGMQLAFESTGKLSLNDTTAFDVMTQVASSPLIPKDVWTRVDLVFSFATAALGQGAYFELWLNGVLAINIESFANTGQGIAQNHTSSDMGQPNGYDTRGLGLDVDDWVCADVPASAHTGLDWVNGSKVAAIRPTGVSDFGTWSGNWRTLLQEPADDAVVSVTTTAASDVLAVLTDAEQVIDGTPNAIGAAALIVGVHASRGGTGNGSVGYGLAGAAIAYTASVDDTVRKWNRASYRPAGALAPTSMTPLVIAHKTSAGATSAAAYSLVAAVELLGIFGQEDVQKDATPPAVLGNTGIHNAPYPRSAWAQASTTPPVAPVAIISGTYTGNDTGQDLTFQFPPTWLMIRHVDNAHDGSSWWSSMFSARRGFRNKNENQGAVQILVDPDFVAVATGVDDQLQQYLVRLVGNQANVNAAGETYVYTAFCDPGMRFTVNGAAAWPRGTVDRITKLWRTIFTPEAVFLQRETVLGTNNTEMWFKGRGHATQSISRLDAAETTSAIILAKGQITTKSALHFSSTGNQIAFAAWRRDDGSGDPGIPKTVQIFSYVGDGTGTRTIAFPTVSGVRPLWALVVPHDAAAVFRDSSHGGTSSTTVPATTNTSTGIRGGGIDQLIVGSALNTNAITYEVFILPGGTAGCNGGFSCPGTFVPVEPIPPGDWNGCSVITVAPANLPHGTVGAGYSQSIVASGGSAPYTYAIGTGALPAGLSLSSGGAITGTPSSGATAHFSVVATDADDCTGEAFYAIEFQGSGCPDLTLTPDSLPTAIVGQPYNQGMSASGGQAPYTFTVSIGALPTGFFMGPTGLIFGVLTSPVAAPFTIRATDANGCFAEAEYSLVPDDSASGPGCTAANLAIANRALARIGISKPIVVLGTDLTPEATLSRLHLANDVDTVLRDFPWPFATKYATLTLVAGSVGSPVNVDWTYAYRQPHDCVFERRIVIARGGAVDPTPPPLQLSSDTVGGLIFTNQVNAILEYTARPGCTALRGDALFRDALTWRHALSLAPGLSRMTDAAVNCEKAYLAAIARAYEVLKPNNPGAPPASPTVDTAAASQAANLAVCNRALVRIGATMITTFATDQSREATTLRNLFEDELRTVLRDHPWAFASGYMTPALVAGTEAAPVNADWTYSYRVPTTPVVLMVRRLVPELRRRYDPDPPVYRLGRDATGALLFVNVPDPVIEVTTRPEGCVAIADALFRDALAWRLAAAAAPSLGTVDPTKPTQTGRGADAAPRERNVQQGRVNLAAWCEHKYREALSRAETMDAREQQQEPPQGDAPWTTGRN